MQCHLTLLLTLAYMVMLAVDARKGRTVPQAEQRTHQLQRRYNRALRLMRGEPAGDGDALSEWAEEYLDTVREQARQEKATSLAGQEKPSYLTKQEKRGAQRDRWDGEWVRMQKICVDSANTATVL